MTHHAPSQFSRAGRVYLAAVIVGGLAAIAGSSWSLYSRAVGPQWLLVAVLTVISSSISLKMPSVPASVSISETFLFASIILFGPAAGTLTVAIDGLVISVWMERSRRQPSRLLFNVAAPAISIWAAAHVLYASAHLVPTGIGSTPLDSLLLPLVLCALTYFALNTGLIAVAVSHETGLSPFAVWREHFAWLSLNYFAGASLALLLVAYTRHLSLTHVALIAPVLVVVYFTFRASMGRVRDSNQHLVQVNRLYLSTIEALALAIDAKDQVTHGHIRRVQTYAIGLARRLGVKDEGLIKAIEAAALLHDTGKIAIPEHILNKPGRLTPAEFEKMKTHARIGADILSEIDFPFPVVPIVRHHHENWNGTGYPDGIRGIDIPIGARILSVVDCFDALTSDRPYRRALSEAEANEILMERRGTMYDPLVVDTFIRVQREIAPEAGEPADAAVAAPVQDAADAPAGARSDHDDPQLRRASSDDGATDMASAAVLALVDLAARPDAPRAAADVLPVVLSALARLAPADLAVVYLYEAATDAIVAGPAAGLQPDAVAGLRIALGDRLSGWVAANRRPAVNSDPALDLCGTPAGSAFRSCLAVPLLHGDQLVGVATLYAAAPDAYTREHQRAIEVVAAPVARALAQAAALTRSDRARSIDVVTGLPNRTRLNRLASGEEGRTLPGPIALVTIDVGATDSSGLTGRADDAAMVEAAARLRRALRPGDLPFRLGPDHLAVVLLGTPAEEAAGVAECVMSKLNADLADGRRLMVKAGVATAPGGGTELRDLVDVAVEPFALGAESLDFLAAVS